MPEPVTLVIHETLPSLNKWYAGQHWTKRKKTADHWHRLVHLAIGKSGLFDGPVRITVGCVFPPRARLIDVDNLCAKLVIDGLKGRIIADDNPRHLHTVTLGPCVRGPAALTLIRVEGV